MRSSRAVRATDSQWRSRNGLGLDPSILRHSGIWGAADEAVLTEHKKKKEKKVFFMNQFPQGPMQIIPIGLFQIFLTIHGDIYERIFISSVNETPAIKEKNVKVNIFSYLLS